MDSRLCFCIALFYLYISHSNAQDYELLEQDFDIWEANEQEAIFEAKKAFEVICDNFDLTIQDRVIQCADIVLTPHLQLPNNIHSISKRDAEQGVEGSGSGVGLIEEEVILNTKAPLEAAPVAPEEPESPKIEELVPLVREPLPGDNSNDSVIEPSGEHEPDSVVPPVHLTDTNVEEQAVNKTEIVQQFSKHPAEEKLDNVNAEEEKPAQTQEVQPDTVDTEKEKPAETPEKTPENPDVGEEKPVKTLEEQPSKVDVAEEKPAETPEVPEEKQPSNVNAGEEKPVKTPVIAAEEKPAETPVIAAEEKPTNADAGDEKPAETPVIAAEEKPSNADDGKEKPAEPPVVVPQAPEHDEEKKQSASIGGPHVLPSDLAEDRKEAISEHQSDNADLLEHPHGDTAPGVEGSESDKVLRNMANKASQEIEKEAPSTGQSEKTVQRASKSTTVLLVLLVVVLVAGAAILIRKYTGNKKAASQQAEANVKNGDIEQGTEMKPLMKEKNDLKEYSDSSPKEVSTK